MTINNNAILLSVVIPFKDEENIIKKSVSFFNTLSRDEVELIFVDDGSSDKGSTQLKTQINSHRLIMLQGLGTGKAFYEGMKQANGQYVLLLPVDCIFDEVTFSELLFNIRKNESDVIVFPKKYSTHNEMKFYSFIQNIILLRVFHIAAWTNGIVIKKDHLEKLLKSVEKKFLNDLELSRQLRWLKWKILNGALIVSPRRYHHDGAWRRILINGLIVFLWTFRLASIEKMYQLYLKGK
jgi:glycosyltransferase involved in cell wall biosynthesis